MFMIGFVALISFLAGYLVSYRKQSIITSDADPFSLETLPVEPMVRTAKSLLMVVWMAAWTFAILLAAGILIREAAGGATLFVMAWLLVAVAGWISAALQLFGWFGGR